MELCHVDLSSPTLEFRKWSLYFFFSLSNTVLLFFPCVLIHFIIDLTLLVALLDHLLTLLWSGLVFIAMYPYCLATVVCSISSSTS